MAQVSHLHENGSVIVGSSPLVVAHELPQRREEPGLESPRPLLTIVPADFAGRGSGFQVVTLPVTSLGAPRKEVWRAGKTVETIRRGSIEASITDDLIFGAARVAAAGDLRSQTFAIYRGILDLIEATDRRHLVRLWNYFPKINHIEDIERYQLFCIGRYEAFEHAGLDMNHELPAGSAVGSHGDEQLVVFLASRKRPRYVENPRQVSAYRYPERYGPRSPSFARAALLEDERALFISGTASIVGHETLHVGQLSPQIEETLRNLDAVIETAFGTGMQLDSECLERYLRVYIRHEKDQPTVARRLEMIVEPSEVLYLHADICRSDLLVEIEGFFRRP